MLAPLSVVSTVGGKVGISGEASEVVGVNITVSTTLCSFASFGGMQVVGSLLSFFLS